jgi:hypothetical protein
MTRSIGDRKAKKVGVISKPEILTYKIDELSNSK